MYNCSVSLVVLSYLLCVLGLGIYSYYKTNSFADYVLGGRKLGAFRGAMNVCTSDMSGWILMAVPGAFYLRGMEQIWMAIGLVAGSYWSWTILARRLRCYSELAGNSLTVASFLENRFVCSSVSLRILSSVVIIFFFTVYIASGLVGSARLFSRLYDISYDNALYIFGSITAFYAFLGGFLAVSIADTVQGGLMILVLLVMPFVLVNDLGGVNESLRLLLQHAPNHLNPFYQFDLMIVVSALAWGLGYLGQPHIINKYMAITSSREIVIGRTIAITWMIISFLCAMLIGLLGYVIFIPDVLSDPEMILIELSRKLAHPFVLGLVIVAIMSAIMSTLNAQILVCSSTLSEDLYRRFFRKKAGDREMILVTRLAVLLVLVMAMVIAKHSVATILELVGYAWSGLGASLGPTVVAALFFPKMTRKAAIVSIASGSLGVIVFSKLPYFQYPIFPAFMISAALAAVTSLLTKNDVPEESDAMFAKMRAALRSH